MFNLINSKGIIKFAICINRILFVSGERNISEDYGMRDNCVQIMFLFTSDWISTSKYYSVCSMNQKKSNIFWMRIIPQSIPQTLGLFT